MNLTAVRPTHRRPALATHISSLTAAISGVGIMISGIVDRIDGGPDASVLFITGVVIAIAGSLGWTLTTVPVHIRRAQVFGVVAAAWITLSIAGAIPYLLTDTISRFDNALFESIAGFTTTGATVLRPIEGNSAGILFWRSITQWLGGMGVIVLVVAVLPAVGAGGMDLLEAESPGPTGDRLTPKVRETARSLWTVYVGLTIILMAAYSVAGMSVYDAVSHAFTTVSTGGFSPYNRSIAHFDSAFVEWIAIFGMFAAGGSFTLYYRLIRGAPGPLLRSVEFRLYALLVVGAAAMVWLTEGDTAGYGHEGIRGALFTINAIVSTTGYATVNFASWSDANQMLILLLLPVGAMAGSTAGGIKLIRVLAVGSFARREMARQLHPRIVRPIRVGSATFEEPVANRVLGFLVLALVLFGTGTFAVALCGESIVTSFSASATAIGNVGPGLGAVGPTSDFLEIPAPGRAVLQALMLFGRLEIYPLLLAAAGLWSHRPRMHRQRSRR